MKPLLLLLLAFALVGCGSDFRTIDAEVEILGLLPSAVPNADASAVLYRVTAPSELAGKYGVDYTRSSSADIEKMKGGIFKIRRIGKWRHLLTDHPPLGASVSVGEDFFSTAAAK